MKKVIALFLLGLCMLPCSDLIAQKKYPIAAIPAALLKEAHVVKRMEETSVEVVNLGEVAFRHKIALTILDEAGQDEAEMVVGYDRLHKIGSLEGALYDAEGNLLKKVKGKEIGDYSATSDINLYDDSRVKVHSFAYKAFPYTVEYDTEVEYNNTFLFRKWIPQSSEHYSVEQSSFTVVTPTDYKLRYKAFNCGGEPLMTTEKDKKVMRWEVKNLNAIVAPFAAPLWHELTPVVFISPGEFQMEGFKGDASSWQELGRFQIQLNAGRDQLPPAIAQKVAQLTEGVTDSKEKIRKLYEFLQQNTRYISVQLGIGGLQPFEASYVAQKGYGDCKALSNYMYSMLKAAGIKSYYTWIRGGRDLDDRFVMDDFPFDHFNHIVLCVPMAKDTVWLECTSQSDPAGYMGAFTGNRKALAITEDGGKLISTPSYGVNENVQLRKISGVVDEQGNLTANISSSYTAMQQDRRYAMMEQLSKETIKKVLNEELNFSTYEINDFSYKAKKDIIPEVDEALQLAVSGYATVSGRRLFITPNLMSRDGQKEMETEGRTCDFVFSYSYRDIDTVEVALPSGYQVEAMPQSTTLKTPYGNYECTTKMEGAKILYYRKMERFSGRFEAKEGVAIAKFYEGIYKADRSRIVLVKKE